MEILYKYWLCYYVFIKKVKKKWPSHGQGPFTLALLCIFINVLLIFVTLELILEFKGVLFLLRQGLPLAPITVAVVFIILIPLSIIEKKIKDKRRLMRYAIAKAGKLRMLYSNFYLIFSGIAFIFLFIIVVMIGYADGIAYK